jgi:hypothetical protein
MKPIYLTYIALLTLIATSCGGEKQQPSIAQPVPQPEKVIEDNTLVISSFDSIPDDIEGCSCLFSTDSLPNKNNYLLASKYGGSTNFSYMMVNGKMLRLTESERADTDTTATIAIYKADKIEVEVNLIHGIKTGEESNKETGTITVKQDDGQTITKNIYGECGC